MSGSHRILIVEDEPNARLVLRTALVSNDYSVSTALHTINSTALHLPGSCS